MLSEKIIERLKNAGADDSVVDDILSENARNFVEEIISLKDEEEIKEAINYYREGFFRG